MTNHLTTIPEALLKLKAAFEEGKRDETNTARAVKEIQLKHSTTHKKKQNESSLTSRKSMHQRITQVEVTAKHDTIHIKSLKQEHTGSLSVTHTQKPHINAKPIPLSRNERVKAALTWLCETFPNLFKMNERLPLKIGITHDIAAWIDAHKAAENSAHVEEETAPFAPSKTAIRDAITVYTNTPLYQKALLNNDKRYDLDGKDVGIVETQHKEHADQRNITIETAIQAKAEKHAALRERRKMIAETWKIEKEAKKSPKTTS